MANGDYGAVDRETQGRMTGAMGYQEGMARIFTAGQDPSIVTAAMQTAQNRGRMAAENIRNRYFKAEWKQINEAVVAPQMAQLQAAVARRDAALKVTTMPVTKTLTMDQARASVDMVEPQGPPTLQSILGKPSADGTQTQETVEMPAPPQPNPALQNGPQMNALASEDVMAIIDPASGQPIPLSSPRGIAVMNEADHMYWGEQSTVLNNLMNSLAEYAGNPLVGHYMNNMMGKVVEMANTATTGSGDPMAAQKMWDQRLTFEADLEAKKANTAQSRAQTSELLASADIKNRALGAAQGETMVKGRAAQQDPELLALAGPGADQPVETMPQPKRFELEASYNLAADQAKKAAAARKDSNRFYVEDAKVGDPMTWPTEFETYDKNTQHKKQTYKSALVMNRTAQLAQEAPDTQLATLLAAGATEEEAVAHVNGVASLSQARLVELLGADPVLDKQATALSLAENLATQIRHQPELKSTIVDVINSVIENQTLAHERGDLDGNGNPIPMPDEEALWADPFTVVAMATTGVDIKGLRSSLADYTGGGSVAGMDPETVNRVGSILTGRQNAPKPLQVPPLLARPPAQNEPTESPSAAPQAAAPTNTIRRERLPNGNIRETIVPPQERPAQITFGSSLRALAGDSLIEREGSASLANVKPLRERAFSRELVKFTPRDFTTNEQGQEVMVEGAVLNTGNPYMALPLAALIQQIQLHDGNSPMYSLIVEAIQAHTQGQ